MPFALWPRIAPGHAGLSCQDRTSLPLRSDRERLDLLLSLTLVSLLTHMHACHRFISRFFEADISRRGAATRGTEEGHPIALWPSEAAGGAGRRWWARTACPGRPDGQGVPPPLPLWRQSP
eukprot:15272074-Alexandrium_andersonii.AAC.1